MPLNEPEFQCLEHTKCVDGASEIVDRVKADFVERKFGHRITILNEVRNRLSTPGPRALMRSGTRNSPKCGNIFVTSNTKGTRVWG